MRWDNILIISLGQQAFYLRVFLAVLGVETDDLLYAFASEDAPWRLV